MNEISLTRNPVYRQTTVDFSLPPAERYVVVDPEGVEHRAMRGVDLGPVTSDLVQGNLFREGDNTLYVSMHISSCGDAYPVSIPLDGLEYGPHTLRIRWEAEGVYLRIDLRPEVATGWIPPGPAPVR